MHGGDRNQHIHRHAKSGNSAEEAEDQSDSSKELRRDGERREQCGDMHLTFEVAHGAGEAVAAEPARHLLRAVREEDNAQYQTENRGSDFSVRFQ